MMPAGIETGVMLNLNIKSSDEHRVSFYLFSSSQQCFIVFSIQVLPFVKRMLGINFILYILLFMLL